MQIVVVSPERELDSLATSLQSEFDVTVVDPENVTTAVDEFVSGAVIDCPADGEVPVNAILREVPKRVTTVIAADPSVVSPQAIYEAGGDEFIDRTGPETSVRVRHRLEHSRSPTKPGLPDRWDELRILIEHAPVPIGIVAADGTIIYANEAAASFISAEYSSEIEGQSVFSFAASESAPDLRSRLKQVIMDRVRTEPIEQEFVGLDGANRVAVVTTIPIRHDGQPAGQFVLNDITEQKRRERELRQFKQAVEDAGHAIFITDVDGQITYVNRAFETITGFESPEAIGKTPRILKSGEHDEQYYQRLWNTIRNGEMWEEEVKNARKDGEIFHAEQTISPIIDDGDVTGFVAIQQDITELKQYEAELETRNNQLERFASVVSHDLRNPLTVAIARSEIIQDRLETDPDVARESISMTISALDRIERIIDDLLSLTRDGVVVGDPEPVSLGAIATACFSHVAPEADCLTVDEDNEIMADQGRLRSLLENLFRNAIEHGGKDTCIEIGSIEEDGEIDGFFVADDGVGIPPEERETVFEPGQTSTEGGTGLGLSIVKRIAQAHAWTVSVSASADGGARFEVRGVDVLDPES